VWRGGSRGREDKLRPPKKKGTAKKGLGKEEGSTRVAGDGSLKGKIPFAG